MSQILTSGPTPRPAGLREALSEPWPLECAVAPPGRPVGLLPARHGSGAGDPGRRLRELLLAEAALPRASVPS